MRAAASSPCPDHVADRDRGVAIAKRDHVVPVATDLSVGGAGHVSRCDLESRHVGQTLRQQAALQRLGDRGYMLDLFGGQAQTVHRGADDGVVGLPLRRRLLALTGVRCVFGGHLARV